MDDFGRFDMQTRHSDSAQHPSLLHRFYTVLSLQMTALGFMGRPFAAIADRLRQRRIPVGGTKSGSRRCLSVM